MSLARGTFASGTNGGPTSACTTTAAAFTAGRLIVVSVNWEDADTLTSVTDTAGGIWALGTHVQDPAGNTRSRIAYCLSSPGHATNVISANFTSGTAKAVVVFAQEYYDNAVSGTWTFDAQNTNSANSSNTFTTGAVTTATNNQPVAVGISTYDTETFTPQGSWTTRGVAVSDGMFDQLAASAGSYTGSVNGSGNTDWAATIMTFTFTATGRRFFLIPS